MMAKVRRPVNIGLVFYGIGFVLMLTAFVTPNWLQSRHDHDTLGLWQQCEYGACKPIKFETDWYLAVVIFETAAFACSALSVFILLVYVFASTIPDYTKRYILYTSCVTAAVTVTVIVIGAVILGCKYPSLGGHKDIFGNTVAYDLDACLVVVCFAAVCYCIGIASLIYYIYNA